MSFIRKKEIPPSSGNFYLYEVESYREQGKVRQRHIRYIGKAEEEIKVMPKDELKVIPKEEIKVMPKEDKVLVFVVDDYERYKKENEHKLNFTGLRNEDKEELIKIAKEYQERNKDRKFAVIGSKGILNIHDYEHPINSGIRNIIMYEMISTKLESEIKVMPKNTKKTLKEKIKNKSNIAIMKDINKKVEDKEKKIKFKDELIKFEKSKSKNKENEFINNVIEIGFSEENNDSNEVFLSMSKSKKIKKELEKRFFYRDIEIYKNYDIRKKTNEEILKVERDKLNKSNEEFKKNNPQLIFK